MEITKKRNLIKYVVPTIFSSICFFLFTIIDGIFVGQGVGTNALGSVNLTLPFVMGIYALFMLTTIGGVTIIAINLGRKDLKNAQYAFMHSFSATLIISISLSLVGMIFCGNLSKLLGASDTFYQMTKDYLFWYSVFLIPSGLSTLFQGVCRNDGAPVLVSIATIIGTLLNIFGDWYFIFVMKMGVKGAAIATGISQVVTLLIILTHFIRKTGNIYFVKFRSKIRLYKEIAIRGLSESVAQIAMPVATLCMNYVLATKIGDIGINTFSIISYVASFSMAIFFGTSEGLQPLFGQCYGAKKENDLKYYFKSGLMINVIGSIIINILLLLVGKNICNLFGADTETLNFTIQCMPQYAWGFIFMAPNVMITSYLYSTERSKQAIFISILRSIIVNSTVILLLPMIFGKNIIWYTMGIYEIIILIIAIKILKKTEYEQNNLQENSDKIVLRNIRKEDYKQLSKIICKTWEFDEFVSKKIAEKLSKAYLISCLIEQTYTRVAVKNNIPIGVIMGKNISKKCFPLKYYIQLFIVVLSLIKNKEGRECLEFFKFTNEIDKSLLKSTNKNYQGELSFFVVDSEYRGIGLGKRLYENLLRYMSSEEITDFYLYTDTDCNYQFYERQGLSRKAEKKYTFDFGKEKRDMTFYIYEYNAY